MTRTARLGRCGVLVLAGLIGSWLGAATAQAEDANKADIEALKKSLAKYEDYTAAVRSLRQAVSINPIRESAVRRLMTALADAGDLGEVGGDVDSHGDAIPYGGWPRGVSGGVRGADRPALPVLGLRS